MKMLMLTLDKARVIMTEQKELTGSPDIYLIIKDNHTLRYGAEAPKYYRCTFDVKGSYWIEEKLWQQRRPT